MTSSPITSWQIDGETMETVIGFIFLGSKIIAVSDCSHEIKKTLAPCKKRQEERKKRQGWQYANLDSILKSKDIILPTKVCLVKAMFFSSSHVWM